ncbi:hypothetical protein M758_1G231600 [Ceratodon purpureus]|uniref:TIR domain-containing protein n=1 Tax=Ceratodon purpureus TaxID=3225 RepID=A0A8T0J975_CERPU|nr:hypothetical protein KC19_1G238000 [Ceratodon purpureus]KAG0631155.1 hypothetical protein M758_1G231600 [Ceratodon purpureus]
MGPGGTDMHSGDGKRRKDPGTSSGCLDASIEDSARLDEGCPFPRLQSKHKIFLSHSGHQKWFVEWLCEDLERHHRFPFFDKRPSSLPKGDRFPELILEAARLCEMAVVVVSEEYFMSKWPMIELNAFAQARLGSNPRLKILPLFFGLSTSQFSDPSRQGRWFIEWRKWAEGDTRIKANEFKDAVKLMQSFNGIVFNQDMSELGVYKNNVVSSICKTISADIKWDDSHVRGRSRLLEVTREKIRNTQPSGQNNLCRLGFYGVGGLGKTTMCKTLCNELLEFEGNVCHIELGSNRTSDDLLKEVLQRLAGKSEEFLKPLNEGQCRNILRSTTWKQKTFLAVDNVWDDTKSLEQAKMFVNIPFHEGSVIMVTARAPKTLQYIGIDRSHCLEVPELGKEDARSLFLDHAAQGKQFVSYEDNSIIEECVTRCYFRKSERQGSHYLPLALKVLGMHLSYFGSNPSEWKGNLPKVRQFSFHSSEENPVFSIIRVNFDRLLEADQAMFMSIALYKRARDTLLNPWTELSTAEYGERDVIRWLSVVRNEKPEDTQRKLEELKGKGLLEDLDMESKSVYMHDLYFEFAVMESEGVLNPTRFNDRKWVYESSGCSTEIERTASGGCWENLLVLGVEEPSVIVCLQRVRWKCCSNVVVLMLVGVDGGMKGVLNLMELKCLRSLDLVGFHGIDKIEGLEDLEYLTYFQCFGSDLGIHGPYSDIHGPYLGALPASLKVLRSRYARIHVGSDVFARCTNLCELLLHKFRADHDGLDLRNCKSLQSVELDRIQGLHCLPRIPVSGLRTCLQSLKISHCHTISDVSELGHLIGLQHLEIHRNDALIKLPNIRTLTSLQVLSIQSNVIFGDYYFRKIAEVPGLGSLQQLRDLTFFDLDMFKLPNLSGFRQLQDLKISSCPWLTGLEGLGDLPALRCLLLRDCGKLSRLPDLTKSTNLEELSLRGSGIMLYEESICMLANLPLLRPVQVTPFTKVDMVKRKVLQCDLYNGTVETERDLETPPISVRGWFEFW